MAPPRLRYHLLPDPRPSGGDALNLPRGSRSVRLAILFAALLLSPLAAWCQAQALERTLDDFTAAPSGWEAAPATGVRLDLQPAVGPKGGGAVRLAFDFQGHSGYAIARRKLALDLPENYEFAFQIRGDAPIETLEFKLIDAAGDSVWWSVRRDFTFPRDWRRIAIKKRHLSFAWGPAGGGDVRRISALEIVVTAASGGRGTVDVADLTFEPLPPPHPYTLQPALTASSSAPGAEPGRALDGDPATAWHSAPGASPNQWLQVDFRERRELGGLTIDWDGGDGPRRFELLGSTDGATWQTLRAVESAAGDRAALFLPDTDVRALRIHFRAPRQGRGYGVREIGVLPVEAGASENAFFAALAKTEPRGSYPRALSGEQEFWTLVGVDGGRDQALLSEDGRLEAGLAGFSLEPFVLDGPDLIAWSDVKATQALAERSLPIPSVRWERGGLAFEVTAFASGSRENPVVYARYRLRNTGTRAKRPRLVLAVRPFQVDPPSQFLNRPGGVREIHRIARSGRAVVVDGRPVVPLTRPAAFGAMTYDEGSLVERLRHGALPAACAVIDPVGFASAALAYDLRLAPGKTGEVDLAIPLGRRPVKAIAPLAHELAKTVASWRTTLSGPHVELPETARALTDTARTALAHILISRDGPALRPGTRSYARSWIRDGALMSEALLRLGHGREARDFADWYAGYQAEDGRVPCCVDGRGADPVAEHDSHGELLYLIANVFRFTGDRAFLRARWPNVVRAVAYIDQLRGERLTPEYSQPDKLAFRGLLPESISHEGYSAKPVHSYWDDFFALKGLGDAAFVADALGERQSAARFAASRDALRRDLYASIARVMESRHLDYVPASADLGDFDPTSTTAAIAPGGELSHLPDTALRQTFERYWQEVEKRRRGNDWDAYTPYELRAVGTFVRLGWRERAQALLRGFLGDRRPLSWNQWPEVVWRDHRNTGFLGDLPHAWVAAEFLRSYLDLFVDEREEDRALVLAAGVPAEWVASEKGVRVHGVRTEYGAVSYELREENGEAVLRLPAGERVPPGGFAIRWPFRGEATVDGRPVAAKEDGEIVVRRLPAVVRVRATAAKDQ